MPYYLSLEATAASGPAKPAPHARLCHSAIAAALQCLLWAGTTGTLTIVTAAAQAQTRAQQHSFHIPAGPLATALDELARVAGVNLSYDAALVADQNSRGLQGHSDVTTGLQQLLSDTGLEAVPQGSSGFSLRKATAASNASGGAAGVLPEVTVTASNTSSLGVTEGSGSYTSDNASTATRLNLSLRETPQSVSVLTRQQMEDQAIQSVEDVALQVTGLTLARGAPDRAQLRARGFSINTIMLDGVPQHLDSDMTGFNTLAMYDHVEVLRGAAGLMQGTGNPSATINLIRKRPTADRQIKLTGSAGSWRNYRTELDASGPLNEAGTLRGRTVLAWQDTESFRDHYNNDRRLAYAVLEADVAANTIVSLGSSYNREINNGSAWYGVPTYSDGSFLPIRRSANFTPSWAYWNKTNKVVFADLEHRWDNGWKAKLSAQASNADMEALYNNMARVSGTENIRYSFVGNSDYAERSRGVDLHASGPFELLGREHELVFGATWRKHMLHSTGQSAAGYSFTFDPTQPWQVEDAPYPTLGASWGDQNDHTKQYGAYASTRLNLADSLKLILGTRLDWYNYESRYNGSGSGYQIERQVTPYAGIIYDLDSHHSLYTSWTEIFQPQSSKARNGAILPPVTGTNYEVGLKGEYLNGALNASVAAFKIEQTNLAKSLPSGTCAHGVQSCAEAAGEVQSKGLEFELAGQLNSNWLVTAGYTIATAKYAHATTSNAAGERFASDQPRHLIKLFSSYQLPAQWNTWRVGAGVRMQNAIYKDTGAIRIRQGGYTVADLMLAWQVTPELSINLNINNLFDKYYYESIGSPTNGNGFGAPRNFLITAKYRL